MVAHYGGEIHALLLCGFPLATHKPRASTRTTPGGTNEDFPPPQTTIAFRIEEHPFDLDPPILPLYFIVIIILILTLYVKRKVVMDSHPFFRGTRGKIAGAERKAEGQGKGQKGKG